MKLDCKYLSIRDEIHGCTVTFYQEKKESRWNANMSLEQFLSSLKPYILLQRSYGGDEFEEDYYYFESIDFDKSGELKDFTIELHRKQVLINDNNEIFEINIRADDVTFENLKAALQKIANKQGQLIIFE